MPSNSSCAEQFVEYKATVSLTMADQITKCIAAQTAGNIIGISTKLIQQCQS